MALTRPKYSQIFDSDFKNSCRVATTANVTLSGAAPKVVDGVTLKLYDRVLVKAQTTLSQNGIYFVTVLGTGANGTWTRAQDASDGTRLTSGTTLSVEEGSTFGGKLFRMTSPNPINLGVTDITWVDVSGGGGAASGNDGQVQYNDNNAPAGASYLFYNKVSGQLKANATTSSTSTTTGTFIVTGGVGVSENLYVGGNLDVAGTVTFRNTVVETSTELVQGIEIVAGNLVANSGTTSSSTSTGALVVVGGVGISENLYVGANVTVTGNVLPSANVTYNLGSPNQRWKDLYLSGTTINLNGATISATNGAVTFQNSLGGSFSVTGAASGQSTGTFGNLVANSGVASSSTTTGALQVVGGAGISGATYIGGSLNIADTTTLSSALTYGGVTLTNSVTGTGSMVLSASPTITGHITLEGVTATGATGTGNFVFSASPTVTGTLTAATVTASGITNVTNTTISTSTSNGALVVAGGVGVGGTMNVGGNATFGANVSIAGNLVITGQSVSIGSSTLSVQDPVINLHTATDLTPLVANDLADIGIKFHYYDTVDSAAFLGRVNSSGFLEWFSRGSDTANVFTGTAYGTIKVGEFVVANATASSSTTTGAVRVAGGVGIAGATYIGGSLNVGGTITGTLFTASQPNVTALGNLTSISVAGTSTRGGKALITNYTGTLPPASPQQGDEWYKAGSDILYKYVYDGTGYQWVDLTSPLYNANTAAIANTLALRDSGGNLTATNFIGVASSAKYADLAEIYIPDQEYAPGTVVVFGGIQEITVSNTSHDPRVAGVVSTNPAYLMNSECVGLPVAFTGRVPCQVQGPVSKGQLLVTSNHNGVAQAINNEQFVPGCVIGKSLENITTNKITTIEVVVGRF